MAMTTPVYTHKARSDGEKMEMATPVITKKVKLLIVGILLVDDQEKRKMSFVMPSKYGDNLPLPKDSSVRIKEYNPPFTLPFTRCNEIALEVERKNQ
ncbi:hypothetical protein SAY87_027943 [Trapa incisa]|uniref:Uncharacterized protein n=1 Tax=Trapa incisa TaxID=236973 RepID=A0AAN7QN42_9MYRT|nr:hypothetical protein SAY87_027943 [Trapa incisa]